ncbi:MAG TPA: YigZ family protein [Ignavibacteriaceae bacterium]|nr:YigZ family protein [Ignavibacteriaceae bacterium]
MLTQGTIKTINRFFESTYKEKGSEFIAWAFHVETETEVQNYLDETRKKHYDASHHCYAFRFKDNSFRYSDAGEPNGTAGIRILNAIDHFGLKDILVIVTRYFGGTKLGIGPLGKAYYTSAEILLQECSCVEEKAYNRVKIICDFSFISLVYRLLSSFSGIIENVEYGQSAAFKSLIPLENTAEFAREMNDSSNGNILIEAETEIIYHKI